MDYKRKPIEILLVEDSPTDRLIAIEALSEARVLNSLHTVEDGVEAMAFLRREGKYVDSPLPDLILLDLNLPRKDGREVLAEIKGDPRLRVIPVVVLTTSEAEEDIFKAYSHHANCYITKPVDFNRFTEVVRTIENFWFEIVRFPKLGAFGSGPSHFPGGREVDRFRNSGPIRVLVVEDSPTDRLLIEAALGEGVSSPFVLTHAPRIADAAERLGQATFDIILTDLNLPDSSGLDTFRRAYEAARGIPVIVLTANDDEDTGITALQLGAQDYLVKGQTTFPMFSRAIRYAMERAHLQSQLRQANRIDAISQLAGGIANDFNNLITVIRSHAGLLLNEGAEPRAIHESAREISQAADRVAGLTRQLLAFSLRHTSHAKPADLNELIGANQKLISRLMGEAIQVELRLAGQLSPILADAALFEQAFVDLALNARDAMPDGGKFTLATDELVVTEALARGHRGAYPGFFVRLTVSDTGRGIPPEILDRIFEPFVTTKPVGAGSGLGLATVHGIVLQHRGWIQVSSTPEHGTVFEMYFPQAQVPSSPAIPARSVTPAKGSETILVVEDEAMLRQVIALVLKKQGYRVIEAVDSHQALELWKEHRDAIDLLITDLLIPEGMSGIELAKVLRAERPDLKIIFSSGYGNRDQEWEETLEEGVNFLPKPYQSNDLARIVRRRLDA
ncbi:MAG TPA: response regulator [Candidatus Limnocylindria bacterium]|nr:response regulator [Candidatus Limnocylindria bacterium]